MERVLFCVLILVALVLAQGEPLACTVYNPCESGAVDNSVGNASESEFDAALAASPNKGKGSFYFDLTLAPTRRHFEATKVTTHGRLDVTGCHFESDGRYVCEEEDKKPSREEKTIGYTGMGALLNAKMGGLFRGGFVALYANAEIEMTGGETSGRESDESAKPRSIVLALGPGLTFYPLALSSGPAQNLYLSAYTDFGFGGGGGIGLFAASATFELGFLGQVSDRTYMGIAIGGDVMSVGGLSTDIEDEGGYALWVGFKVVRK